MELDRRELFNLIWVLTNKIEELSSLLEKGKIPEDEIDEVESDKAALEMLLEKIKGEV